MPGKRCNWSRREFLGAGLGALAAPTVITSPLFAGAHRVSANDRITMALIGCGGMGNADLQSFMSKPGVQILAVCDPDRDRRRSTQNAVNQFYSKRSTAGRYSGCDDYNDFRDVLARDDIDAVIIATPDHWHAMHVIAAARAGKDIYGEKPLSLVVRQGRIMSDTIRRYARVFQTGSQQRSDSRFRLACELVRNGRLGTIRKVTCGLPPGSVTGNHPPIPVPDGFDYELWLGPAPTEPYCEYRTHYNFRHILDYSGGKLTDWGAHHIDIVQWALGTMTTGPTRVWGRGTYPEDGLWNAPVHYEVHAEYASGVHLLVTSEDENGVLFEGDAGRLFVSRSRIDAEPKSILTEKLYPWEDRLEVSDDHRQNFLNCVRSREIPIAPIEHAHRSITIAHLGNIAMQLGREIRWDPAREEIVNDDTASRMLDRPMRAPWAL